MIDTFRSLKRTPYQTAAAVLVLYFALFLVATLFASVSFLYGLLSYVETRPQVTVYFQTSTEEADILKLRDELLASEKVASIEYISKEKAYEIYKELTKDNPLLLEMTSPSILPASLEIYATQPQYLSEIAEFLRKTEGVDEVQFQEVIVERLLTLTNVIRNTSFALFIFLGIMSVVVMAATTSFKIALKKDEIEILRLLGAGKFYIIKPFLAQGIVISLLSAIMSFVTLLFVQHLLQPFLKGYLQGLPTIGIGYAGISLAVWPVNPMFLAATFGLITIFGFIITFIANIIAINKYLS